MVGATQRTGVISRLKYANYANVAIAQVRIPAVLLVKAQAQGMLMPCHTHVSRGICGREADRPRLLPGCIQ